MATKKATTPTESKLPHFSDFKVQPPYLVADPTYLRADGRVPKATFVMMDSKLGELILAAQAEED
tara:strand:+ start:1221 stop:1415 length:195 start_codon:yes stop_codon:yes gene_type:complete